MQFTIFDYPEYNVHFISHLLMKQLLFAFIIAFFTLFCVWVSVSRAWEFSFWRQRWWSESVKSLKNINISGVADGDQEAGLLDVIKWITNWVLGVLALIALILVMYGGFLMVTSAGADDAYTKWRTIMKSALIGLCIIGIAWFVVSIIIWLIQQRGTAAEWTSACTDQ